MKRPIILGLIFFFAASFLNASTQVPDTLSGDVQWDSSQSPYIIQGKVEVPAGSVLHIGPGVHVVYQGVGELSVKGSLEVAGSAAAPVVFDMTQAPLQSQFVMTGSQGTISAARFLGGIFLIRDSQVDIQESEFTKGSGIYLQGKTEAYLKSNKIYGNATGAVLDGPALKATFVFNTFVQNTYGLYVKNYLYLKFSNNSVHDNNLQVINITHGTAQLGGNYWGTMDSGALHLKTQGAADYSPLKDLKDVLRTFIMTQLPEITVAQSKALAAKERKQEKADALAMKKWQKQEAQEAKAAAAAAAKAGAPAETAAPAPEVAAPEEAPVMESAPPATGVAVVKPLPPAPHSLTPLANLPPEQDLNLSGSSSVSAAPEPEVEAAPSASALPPPALPSGVVSSPEVTVPNDTLPPPPDTGTASSSALPPPPSDDNSIPPPPAGMDSGSSAGAVNANVPPHPVTASNPTDLESAPPPPPSNANPANGMEEVPPVPPTAVPPAPPEPTATPTPATGRVSASNSSEDLQAPSADLSGMAPPPGAPSTSSAASTNTQAPVTSTTDLALPPIQDLDVPAPKDLDLPATGDLGNLDLDNKK
jgi:hypothetical protein